jgi:hypothetical protein
MLKVDKGVPIGDWTRKYAYMRELVSTLAARHSLTTSSIYQYIKSTDEGDKDIRVIGDHSNGVIYEVRRLGK